MEWQRDRGSDGSGVAVAVAVAVAVEWRRDRGSDSGSGVAVAARPPVTLVGGEAAGHIGAGAVQQCRSGQPGGWR